MGFYKEIIGILKKKKLAKDDLTRLKIKLAKKYSLRKIPTDIEILLHSKEPKQLKHIMTKPVRSISGVSVIALMTKPFPCPHAKKGIGPCTMCPGGIDSEFGDVPQSYTGNEPATMRGIRNKFDPYLQVFNRLEQYTVLGHNYDKIEMIIMGGTFPSFPKKYRHSFITYAFKAMNDFSFFFDGNELDLELFRSFFELPGDIHDPERMERLHERILILKNHYDGKNKKIIVENLGLNADFATNNELKIKVNEKEIKKINIKNNINFKIKHELNKNIEKNIRLKNINNKINLIFKNNEKESNKKNKLKKEINAKLKLKTIIPALKKEQLKNEITKIRCVALCIETRPDYCRKKHIDDMLELGCTRVELGVQHTDDKILENVNRGHTVKDSIIATRRLKDALLKVGYHIMPGLPGSSMDKDLRMFQQIFADDRFRPDALKIYPCMVVPGTKLYLQWKKGKFKPLTTQQAALLIAKMKSYVPEFCRIMRVQRDIPTKVIAAGVDRTNLRQYVIEEMRKLNIECSCIRCREPRGKKLGKIMYSTMEFDASGRKEYFLQAESQDKLVGFLRLRILGKMAGVRELHVYGEALNIGAKGVTQHKGVGKKLMSMAENIAKENKCNKVRVISGIGVKEYYKKLGYVKKGYYVERSI